MERIFLKRTKPKRGNVADCKVKSLENYRFECDGEAYESLLKRGKRHALSLDNLKGFQNANKK